MSVTENERMLFSAGWRNVARQAWQTSEDHGFHGERTFADKIALMHSELSEALEADRHGNPPSEKTPEFSHVEEELADLVIRLMDEATEREYDIPGAVMAKMRYNESRPFRHGKAY